MIVNLVGLRAVQLSCTCRVPEQSRLERAVMCPERVRTSPRGRRVEPSVFVQYNAIPTRPSKTVKLRDRWKVQGWLFGSL